MRRGRWPRSARRRWPARPRPPPSPRRAGRRGRRRRPPGRGRSGRGGAARRRAGAAATAPASAGRGPSSSGTWRACGQGASWTSLRSTRTTWLLRGGKEPRVAPPRAQSGRSRPRSAAALGAAGLGVLCVSQFVDVLSVNTAVIALPDIRRDLGLGASGAQWVISIYALLFGALLVPAGRLADRVGHRRLFSVGLVGFAGASLLCGAAPSPPVLIGARAATGVAAALTVPAALALLVAGTDEARRPRALGWWTAAGAGGGIAGLALGGVITDLAGWRAAFVAPAVLAFACLPFVTAVGPARPGDDRRPLDVRGTVAGVAGLVLLLGGLSAIGQGGGGVLPWVLLLVAAATLLAFARIESRAPFPLLAPGFLADRRLAAGTLASAVNTAATGPLAVLGAIYLQDIRGWSPAANGLSFVPFSAMVIVGSALGAPLLGRLGTARTFGLALVAPGHAAGVLRDHRRRRRGGAHRGAGDRRARARGRRRDGDDARDGGGRRGDPGVRGRAHQHGHSAGDGVEHRSARPVGRRAERCHRRAAARLRRHSGDRGRGRRGRSVHRTSHSVSKLALTWMSTWRSGPSPELTKACHWPAGMTTISPAPTARGSPSSPRRKVAVPSCVMTISGYGWRCSEGPAPGGASTKIAQMPTPPWSAPTNSRAMVLGGSSSSRMISTSVM